MMPLAMNPIKVRIGTTTNGARIRIGSIISPRSVFALVMKPMARKTIQNNVQRRKLHQCLFVGAIYQLRSNAQSLDLMLE